MFPVGDSTKSSTRPWVNYLLIAVNIAVFRLHLITLETHVGLPGPAAPRPRRRIPQRASATTASSPCRQRSTCSFASTPSNLGSSSTLLRASPPFRIRTVPPFSPQSSRRSSSTAASSTSAATCSFSGSLGDNVEDRFGHFRYNPLLPDRRCRSRRHPRPHGSRQPDPGRRGERVRCRCPRRLHLPLSALHGVRGHPLLYPHLHSPTCARPSS